MTTPLHEERLDAVMAHLLSSTVETVVDLGCGSGPLLERLLSAPHLRRIVGVDRSSRALLAAAQRLTGDDGAADERLSLRQGSVLAVDPDLVGFDAAVMVETIEHLEPAHLSRLEASVFARLRPGRVMITTPNREYNVLHGLGPDEYRHPDHRFEWDRPRFQRWATGVARRNQYSIAFEGIGPANTWYGSSTQMAVFRSQRACVE
jgi:small RNA 2'-O-methyltransferase